MLPRFVFFIPFIFSISDNIDLKEHIILPYKHHFLPKILEVVLIEVPIDFFQKYSVFKAFLSLFRPICSKIHWKLAKNKNLAKDIVYHLYIISSFPRYLCYLFRLPFLLAQQFFLQHFPQLFPGYPVCLILSELLQTTKQTNKQTTFFTWSVVILKHGLHDVIGGHQFQMCISINCEKNANFAP